MKTTRIASPNTNSLSPNSISLTYFPAKSSVMTPPLLKCALLLAHALFPLTAATSNAAYPPPYGIDQPCTSAAEVNGGGRIIDISHRYHPDLPAWESPDGIGRFLWLTRSMKNGSVANFSEMKLSAHTGTHVDAPGHVFDHYFDAGFDAASLDLDVLNGDALVVDVPRDTNITAEVMKSLNIPKGVRRVLFRTLNTDRGLMYKKAFDTSYVGFMNDGAQWLVDNTDIKLVGVDYLSVATFDDLLSCHLIFLEGREIIPVEGLKLDGVEPGIYSVHCLPLRLVGAEGSPVRCILIKP